MKRFLTAIFVLLLFLAGDASYAQDNADPPADTTALSSEIQGNKIAKTAPKAQQNEAKIDYTGPALENLTVDERMANIAQEANNWALYQTIIGFIGLIFVIAATAFAGLAWRAGERGVAVTRKSARAEYQPYLTPLNDSFDVARYSPSIENTEINFVGDFDIKNIGRTPASNVTISAKIKYKSQGREFNEDGIITGWRFGDLYPDKWRTFKLNFVLHFPDGDASDFMKIRELDIFLYVKFRDMFTETRIQKLYFLIDDIITGAELQSIEEKTEG